MPTPSQTNLRPVLWIIAAATLLRLLYVCFVCPYDLIEDEAHYWLWAQHLDWSYYSKGPGVAWAIWLSTKILGNAEWAVRMPAVIASGVVLLGGALLARDIQAERAAPPRIRLADDEPEVHRALLWIGFPVLAVLALLLAPAFQLTSILMTIDGPYVACWAIACWTGWRAMERGSERAWLGLGAALALGFLFKYTILLLPPGLLAYAIVRRGSLNLSPRWRAFAAGGLGLFLLGLAPVIIWNAQNDWVTVHHLLGHLGVRGGDVARPATPEQWSPRWTLNFIGSQFGIVGPLLVLALFAANRAVRRRKADPERFRGDVFLILCAAPVVLFYLAVSFIAEPEGNWAIAGYVTLLLLAARRAADVLVPAGPKSFSPVRFTWNMSVIYALVAALMLHRADLAAAAATRITMWEPVAWVCLRLGYAPRTIVPGRLIGAREMAAHAAELAEDRGASFLICDHYGRASQMAYYFYRAADDPYRNPPIRVYCASRLFGGRPSQFDLWRDTEFSDPSLRGYNALLMSNDKPHTLAVWQQLFDRVETIGDPPANRLRGEHKKDRVAYLGYGYFPPPPSETVGRMEGGK